MHSRRSASELPRAPSGVTSRGFGRSTSSGSSSRRLRSDLLSVACHALINTVPSCTLSLWRSTAAAIFSCSLCASAQSACASVGPSTPSSMCFCSNGASWRASTRRCVTQCILCPTNSATPATVMPSLVNASTTRASSIAVTVRRGALARSSASIASCRDDIGSTTTGTDDAPPSRQRARRLKPSTTSRHPSSMRTARIGRSASSRPSTGGGGAP